MNDMECVSVFIPDYRNLSGDKLTQKWGGVAKLVLLISFL